jgi:hypothetical protein
MSPTSATSSTSPLPTLAKPLLSLASTVKSFSPATPPAINPSTPSRLTPGQVTNPVPGATQPVNGGPALPPAAPAAGSAPAPGADANAANGGPFTPTSVSVGNTVLPNQDPRLTGTQSAVDTASQSLANVDRTKLAQQMFDTFTQSTNPAYEASIRDATRAAAGAGRIGSGQLRTSYGNLANQRNLQLGTAQQQFMQDALEGSIGDQFNKVNALSGLEGQQYGEGADTNNQLRTERGYQTDLSQQAFNNALTQWRQRQADQQQKFGQGITTLGLADANNPAGTIAALGAQGVDPSILAILSSSLAQRQGSTGVTTPTPNGGTYNGSVPLPPGVS